MPRPEAPLYRRGKYWLAWDRKKDGTLRSPFLTIFWYDPTARRTRSCSTGTTQADEAMIALDRRYLADEGEAPAFCHACGRPIAAGDAYLVLDAVADYRLEHGDLQSSADTIAARLKHVTDFLVAADAHARAGSPSSDPCAAFLRFTSATTCAVACTKPFAETFRQWSHRQPVVWRNGDGEITASKPRSPATTEESLIQLAAALNHAVDAPGNRSDSRPLWKPEPRRQVTRPRRTRVDVAVLARMAAYAAEPNKRRGSLHAFIVGTLCTIARPDSVVDISVAPDRRQWWPGAPTIDLNPHGRRQTKKFRPVLPVLPLLDEWLQHTWADYQALPEEDRVGRGWLVNYYGRPVQDVDSAWSSMLTELKLPTTREWKPYLLRHSLASMVRRRGAPKWEVQGFMGHHPGDTTETYAVGENFPAVAKILEEIISDVESLVPGALHRKGTGAGLSVTSAEGRKMTG
jgi:integrase